MTIGILGSDARAVTIGKYLQAGGHTVTFSDPAGMDKAEKAALALGGGATADSAYHQAATCEMLVLALHWDDVEQALALLGPYPNGMVIDAIAAPKLPVGNGAELLARKLNNRHLVKAFVELPRPHEPLQYCTDDPDARTVVEEMIRGAGFIPVDLGPLSRAGEIEAHPILHPA